jgi:hypothetical protein
MSRVSLDFINMIAQQLPIVVRLDLMHLASKCDDLKISAIADLYFLQGSGI